MTLQKCKLCESHVKLSQPQILRATPRNAFSPNANNGYHAQQVTAKLKAKDSTSSLVRASRTNMQRIHSTERPHSDQCCNLRSSSYMNMWNRCLRSEHIWRWDGVDHCLPMQHTTCETTSNLGHRTRRGSQKGFPQHLRGIRTYQPIPHFRAVGNQPLVGAHTSAPSLSTPQKIH